MKFLVIAIIGCLVGSNVLAQNVGINTVAPVENLQVDSSIKVGKNLALLGAKKNLIKFGDDAFVTIGEEGSDDKMYIRYGTLSLMRSANSVGNGFMGINTDLPTTTLDVNGGVRIRGNGAAAGKTLTSDANGVATWTGPVAFAAYKSTPNLVINSFQANSTIFTALEYETTTGIFSTTSNDFTAPVTGIYHFSGTIAISSQVATAKWKIILSKSNGFNKEFDYKNGETPGLSLHFSFDTKMNAGEQMSLIFFNFSNGPVSIIEGSDQTFFSAHLLK